MTAPIAVPAVADARPRRRPRRRAVAALALVAIAAVTGAGCGEKQQDSDEVLDAIDATIPLSHRFSYAVTADGEELVVQGIVEDAFRYKLQLAEGSRPVVEQIVSDDTVAVRFLDPAWVDRLTDTEVAALVDPATEEPGATVPAALRAQRWVVDAGGAPSALLSISSIDPAEADGTDQPVDTTSDPIFDARTALEYVRAVTLRSQFVRYDPDAVEPTYRSDEDPFPAPEDGSGITRYDSVLQDLPSANQAVQGAQSVFPDQRSFRRMAVYVQDGRVVRVMEVLGVTPRTLNDLAEYLTALVKATAPAEVQRQFAEALADARADPERLTTLLLDGLNSYRRLAGQEAIEFRTVDLRLRDFGAADIGVTLPTDGVFHGSLASLRNIGRKPAVDDGSTPSAGVIDTGAPSSSAAGPAPAPGAAPSTTVAGG